MQSLIILRQRAASLRPALEFGSCLERARSRAALPASSHDWGDRVCCVALWQPAYGTKNMQMVDSESGEMSRWTCWNEVWLPWYVLWWDLRCHGPYSCLMMLLLAQLNQIVSRPGCGVNFLVLVDTSVRPNGEQTLGLPVTPYSGIVHAENMKLTS